MLGSLIGAGASLVGGLLGKRSQDKANDANYEMQKEFAQHGIRWKVEDAKAAGVHPLYALGANTYLPSPSHVAGDSMPNALAAAGSDISRAVMSKTTNMERLQERLLRSQIEGQEIDNALRASQVARNFSSGQLPPPLPGRDGDVITVPKEITARRGPIEKGIAAAHQILQFGSNGNIMAMSPALAEAGMDEGPAQWYYQLSRTLPGMLFSDFKGGGNLHNWVRSKLRRR